MNQHPINSAFVIFAGYVVLLLTIILIPFDIAGTPVNQIRLLSVRLDYILHALVVMPLLPLWHLAQPANPLLIKLLAGIVFVAGVEIVQLVIPYRTYNIYDLISNLAGVGAGFIFCLFMPRKKQVFS